jgi:mRNA-degrading endonuclease toxin of MazEF toxin-antitoxin module
MRVRPTDRDRHPVVILSPDDVLADASTTHINILYGSTARAGEERPLRVLLNGTDGLERLTTINCRFIHLVPLANCGEKIGSVAMVRRRQISRTVAQSLRLML